MILAAGFGTRLFPLTIDRTKPAIPFLGKPLVGYVAEYIAKFGFEDIVVNLHHQPESVKKALGDGSRFGVRINYTLEEPKILGTAGALDNARHLLENDTFLIINGKIITDIDIAKAIETHKKSGALATMILKPNHKRERFTIVETEGNLIKGFGDFPKESLKSQVPSPKLNDEESIDLRPETLDLGQSEVPLMFTGIHILEPEVFQYIPRGVYSDIVPTFYRPAIEAGKKIVAHVTDGKWFELSTIPRYLDISLAMLNGASEKVIKGANVKIASSARVQDSVIWDGVSIENEAKISNAIIADGVRIGAGKVYENVAIVRAGMLAHCAEIPDKAMKGFFDGENYVVPLNQ